MVSSSTAGQTKPPGAKARHTSQTPPEQTLKGFGAETVQTSPGKPETKGRYDYADRRLRIDQDGRTSAIVDMRTGDMVMILHPQQVYTRITLADMKVRRDEMRKQVRARLAKMPPAMRARLQQQLDEQDAAVKRPVALTWTKKTETVDGLSCRVVGWTSPQDQGQACVTRSVPKVDLSPFREASAGLGERLAAADLGTAALSTPALLLAREGFPLWTRSTLKLGDQSIETTTRFVGLAARRYPRERFRAPKDYREVAFEAFVAAGQARGAP